MVAQIGSDQQAGNIEGQHVEHPLGRFFGGVVVAETYLRPRQVSIDRRIVRVVEVQIFGLVPGSGKLMLVEQEIYLRLAQLKILRSQAEAGGDGFRCLAIVVRRSGLVRPADESHSKIVIGLGASWDWLRSAAWRRRFAARPEWFAGLAHCPGELFRR